MNPVVTTQVGCSVEFSWDPYYSNGGSPIIATKLEVQTKSGRKILTECNKSSEISKCEVKMSVLAAAPFFLQLDESIQDKVHISAQNEVGWSQVSRSNSIAKPIKMTRAPSPITNFLVAQTGKDQATLTWDDFDDQRYDIY